MTAVQIVAVFGGGLVAGLAIGLLVGNGIGFHFGKLLERKRLTSIFAKKIATKTAIEIVQALSEDEKQRKKRPAVAQPGDETRH